LPFCLPTLLFAPILVAVAVAVRFFPIGHFP